MADPTAQEDNNISQLKIETPRALADIGYNTIIAPEQATSSDDEASEIRAIPADNAHTAIAVSIGREQSRLTSPKTPAVEKDAAIERAGGFFGDFGGADGTLEEEPEDLEEEQEPEGKDIGPAREESEQQHHPPFGPRQSSVPERSPRKISTRLPSPWRAEPTAQWQMSNKAKSGLFDGLLFNRKRASSGPDSLLEGWQKSLLSSLPSLPSMPKNLSLSSPFSSSHTSKDYVEASSKSDSKRSSLNPSLLRQESISNVSTAVGRQRSSSDGLMPVMSPRSSVRNVNEPENNTSNLQGRPSLQIPPRDLAFSRDPHPINRC